MAKSTKHTIGNKFVAIVLAWLIFCMQFGSALTINNIRETPTPTGATITYTTDVDATTFVQLEPGAIYPIAAEIPKKSHTVQITGLTSGTQYSYYIQAGIKNDPTQDKKSPIKQFTTLTSADEVFFTANIPAAVQSSRYTVSGKTIPDAFVTIYVNGQLTGGQSGVSSATGDVNMPITLDATIQNTIEVQIKNALTSTPKSFTYQVSVDSVFPQFTDIKIPTISKSPSIIINGSTNKAMTLKADITLANGRTKSIDGPVLTQAGIFRFNIDLDDGINQVTVTGTDSTGAQDTETTSVTVDSQELELDVNFDRYSPTSSSTIYIDGTVNKPGIPVRIYVDPKNRKAGSCSTTTSRTLTSSGDIIEDTKCYGFKQFDQIEIDGKSFESTSETIPNNKTGKYAFTVKVELEPRLTIFVSDKFVPVTGINSLNAQDRLDQTNFDNQYGAGIEGGIAEEYSLFAVAVDRVGNVAPPVNGRIKKEACGNTGEFVVRVQNFYPDLIQPDHVFQGFAQLSFKAELQYIGSGDLSSVTINSVELRPREQNDADLAKIGTDPRLILDPSRCTSSPQQNIGEFVYIVCNLNRYPSSLIRSNITKAYDNLSNIGTVKVPSYIKVRYSVLDSNKRMSPREASQCIDIPLKFDKRVDPGKYPKGLMRSTVKVMNETVTAIDQVLKPLNTIKLVTLGACVGSKVFSIFSYAREEAACLSDALSKVGNNDPTVPQIGPLDIPAIEQVLRGCKDQDQKCIEAFEKNPKWINPGMGQKVMESSCASQIRSRLNTEYRTNMICDRIFCPAVPSASEYIQSTNNKFRSKLYSACSSTGPYTDTLSVSSDEFTTEYGCGKEYQDTWRSACPSVNPVKESKASLAAQDRNNFGSVNSLFGTLNGNLNICSAAAKADREKADWFRDTSGTVYYNDDSNDASCYRIGKSFEQGKYDPNSKQLIDNKLTRAGITDATATDGLNRIESQTKAIGTKGCVVTTKDGSVIYAFQGEDGKPVAFDSQQASAMQLPTPTSNGQFTEQTLSVRKFSKSGPGGTNDMAIDAEGNYYKINGDKLTLVDKPGVDSDFYRPCTTGNNILGTAPTGYDAQPGSLSLAQGKDTCKPLYNGPEELKQNQAKPRLVDPTDGLINSVRCVCLPAIEGYLIVWRNVFNAVKNCFQATLVNNEFKAGACKSLLTTYICDWIYRALKCLTSFAGTASGSGKFGTEDRPEGISSIQSMQKGADRMSRGMQDRYGNTATFNSLIGTHKLMNAVCLAAFGYDWLPELDAAVSIKGGGAAVNSTAFIVTATRRWISSDPTTGIATFIYEAGYFISAGAPIRYQVELVCSNDNSCRSQDGYESTGACDCAQGSGPIEKKVQIDGGAAQGGQTVGDADGKGQKLSKLSREIRYDTLRLTFTDTITPNARPQVIEQKINRIGGQEPPTCTFSMITFSFRCEYASTNKYGDVFFYGDKIKTEKDPYGINDRLNLAVFAKIDYTRQIGLDRETINPSEQTPKYARLQIWNEAHNQLLYEEITPKDTLKALSQNTPFVMGANYQIGDGQTSRGIAGTIRSSSEPLPLGDVGGTLVPFVASSKDLSRASNKANYYILYGTYDFKRNDKNSVTSIIPTEKESDRKWVIIRQNSQNNVASLTMESLSNLNAALGGSQITASNQGGYLTVINDGSTNPYDKVSNSLNIDPSNGVHIGLTEFVVGNKNTYSARLSYDQQSTATLLCGPNQRTVNLVVDISLHDSVAKDRKSDVSPSNAQMSPYVFIYQGAPQNYSKTITVNCDGTSTGINTLPPGFVYRSCDQNKLSWDSDTKWSTISTSKILTGCYCGDASKNVFDDGKIILCTESAPNVYSSIVITQDRFCKANGESNCYCSKAPFSDYTRLTAAPPNQGKYCLSPNICNLEKSDCDGPVIIPPSPRKICIDECEKKYPINYNEFDNELCVQGCPAS